MWFAKDTRGAAHAAVPQEGPKEGDVKVPIEVEGEQDEAGRGDREGDGKPVPPRAAQAAQHPEHRALRPAPLVEVDHEVREGREHVADGQPRQADGPTPGRGRPKRDAGVEVKLQPEAEDEGDGFPKGDVFPK